MHFALDFRAAFFLGNLDFINSCSMESNFIAKKFGMVPSQMGIDNYKIILSNPEFVMKKIRFLLPIVAMVIAILLFVKPKVEITMIH